MKLSDFNKVHFVGVGGYGMSALACVLLERGIRVSGSDLIKNDRVKRLIRSGMTFFDLHEAVNVSDADLVVFSSAVSASNPELAHAEERGVPIVHRADVLCALMKESRCSIGVVGSHGKTTTASMIASVLRFAELEPGFALGGELLPFGLNAACGSGEIFVAELDESDGSFEKCTPDVLVLTNIDNEHIGVGPGFKTMKEMFSAYVRFIDSLSAGSRVFYYAGDANLKTLISDCRRRDIEFTSFGPDSDIQANDIEYGNMCSKFSAKEMSQSFELPMPGAHNVLNALACLGVCLDAGVSKEKIAEGLACFKGIKRRFEILASKGGVTFVEDYGHHPVEIRATINSARSLAGRIVIVFQPHRYSRTQALMSEFAQCFSGADVLVLTEIYAASEEPVAGVTGSVLARLCRETEPNMEIHFAQTVNAVDSVLSRLIRAGDTVVFQGAGDIHDAAQRVAKQYKGGAVGV